MASLAGFDASKVEPSTGFAPLPAGSYLCVISKSEMRPTKSGDGEYLSLTMQVIEGQFAGRLIFDRLNLVNPSSQAMDIAQKTLSAICRAVGVLQPGDSAELHDKPLTVRVKVKDDRNEVTGYSAASAQAAATNTFASPAPAAPAAAKKPWQK